MQETRETRVQSLGQEDPLEEETATHSSILFWKIPWTEEPGRLQSMGSQRVRHDSVTEHRAHTHVSKHARNESQPDVMSEVTYRGYSRPYLTLKGCHPNFSLPKLGYVQKKRDF